MTTARDGREPTPTPGERDASGAALGPRRPRSPDHRPTWLVLLSSLTLIYGGVLFVSSLEVLRDPRAAAAHLPVTHAMTPAEEEVARQIADVGKRVASAHARSRRADAAQSLPVAMLLLFAAAATMSRDRRGRQIALAAGWTAIASQLVSLALTLPIARDLTVQAAPLFAQLLSLQAGPTDGATPEGIAKLMMAYPVLTSAVAIAGALVLISYFGGRRGRVLYGLDRERP
jgi:hypothetical protein